MVDYGKIIVKNKMLSVPSVEVTVDTDDKEEIKFLINHLEKDVIPSIKSGKAEHEKQIKKLSDELKIINKNMNDANKDLQALKNILNK